MNLNTSQRPEELERLGIRRGIERLDPFLIETWYDVRRPAKPRE
jgi:hypothetical protein